MTYLNLISYTRRHLVMLMAVLLLNGCSIVPNSPIVQVYLLPSYSANTAVSGSSTNWSLRVIEPNSNQFLNSTRIAIQPQNQEITVYQDARWSDPAPILVRNRLIQGFRQAGYLKAVSSDTDSLQADFELGGDLLAFQGVYQGGQSEVLLRFDARLVRTSDRRIIASQLIEIRQPIRGTSMEQVVQAFGQAADQLSAKLSGWTVQQANQVNQVNHSTAIL